MELRIFALAIFLEMWYNCPTADGGVRVSLSVCDVPYFFPRELLLKSNILRYYVEYCSADDCAGTS